MRRDRNELPFVAFTRKITCINYDSATVCLHTSKVEIVLILSGGEQNTPNEEEKPLL